VFCNRGEGLQARSPDRFGAGEISLGFQAKLLRFLQDPQLEPIGETRPRSTDVRVIAATRHDLESDVEAGRFRLDLLYRLNAIEVTLPPLRERPEDLERMVQRFVAFFARAARRPTPEVSPETMAALREYSWPGNVRELRNVIESAVILCPSQLIELATLPDRIGGEVTGRPRLGGNYALATIEWEHIQRVLARATTLKEAARILDVDASTLWRKRTKVDSESGSCNRSRPVI
jgi:NtrC-family two-component system response regulator AlgB